MVTPVSNSAPHEGSRARSKSSPSKEELRKMREDDETPVEGVFRCHEPVGGMVKFSFKKYAGKIETYMLKDGQRVTIPKMVAKHLNSRCYYPIHRHAQDADGNPIIDIARKVHRYSFDSLDFHEK